MLRWLRTRLAVRLAVLFFGIVLAAIAVVYFYVAPQLESRLTDEKLSNLETAAQQYSGPVIHAISAQLPVKLLDKAVRQAGDRANARTTLLGVTSGSEGLGTYPLSDSTTDVPISDLQFQVAQDALDTRRPATGQESSTVGTVGEAARPLVFDHKVTHILVFSAPLSDVQSNVALIRRQIRIAGAIALLLAVLAGYLVARKLARRVKRLEQAAGKVAAGDFSEPIPVDSDDELGQLAVAFNDMQRQLARLDSARKQFIAIASHELRTPIFSLGGFVELLEDEELDEATRAEFLVQVRDQIERLTHLATELLDLSRLEAGSLELRAETVPLCELTRRVTGEFAPTLAQHGSRLHLRVWPGEIEAHCDPDRVAQIIRILMDNALTHTPEGTEITVSTAQENGTARVVVTDAGPGIPRASLAHIFEPFYTADDRQGSGLGLAIARELAERMAGRLAVHSGASGTTFTLELPA